MRYLLGGLLALFLCPAFGTTWYVDPTCGSPGDGTGQVCAGATAPKAAYSALTVAAGDEIYFKRGTTHSGAITCASGNSTGDPTLYGAFGTGAKPILTSSTNTFNCGDRDFVRYENLDIRTTLSTSAASIRMDRPQDIVIDSCDFSGGFDGIRMEAITAGGGQTLDRVTISNSTFTGQPNDGIRIIIGATDAAVVSVGLTITGNSFTGIGKEPARFTYQSALFGVRDHFYRSFTFTDNTVTDSLLTTPTVVDDDQCLHFRNIRETTLGNSVIARNSIRNCGRTSGDSALVTGYWFEGMTNVLVYDNVADNIKTPGSADGGAFFLDSNNATATEYVSTGNYFLRNRASNTNNNKACTPFTGSNCNNSEGFSITRGANNNYFISNIAYGNAIGFHVTGNAGTNYFYHNTASNNDYGWFVQSNSGDTPAGQAQVIRNNIAFWNTTTDYAHSTAVTPKADETYNIIGTVVNDTPDATDLRVSPQFVGGSSPTSTSDLRLRATSPARRAGTVVGPFHDFGNRLFATPPSMGAWEAASGDEATARTAATERTAASNRSDATERSAR